jgi:hypothetical protein
VGKKRGEKVEEKSIDATTDMNWMDACMQQ